MGAPSLALALLLMGGSATDKPGIRFEKNFDEALKKARASGKPVLIDFWAEWCGWCHRLDQTTYVDPQVVKLSEDFVAVKVDTEAGPKQAAIASKYDVESLPTILFVSPEGRQLLRVRGYQGPGQFPTSLDQAREIGAKVIGWEAAIDKNPKDAAALLKLGVHLFEQEFYEDARDMLARAAKADADRPSHDRKKARMLMGIIQTYDKKFADAEKVLQEALAIKPAGELEPRILFVLGRAYLGWDKPDKARSVMQEIVASHAGSPVAQKARDTLASLDRKKPQ